MSNGTEGFPKSIQEEMKRMDDFEKKHDAQMKRDSNVSVLVGILFVFAVLAAGAFIIL